MNSSVKDNSLPQIAVVGLWHQGVVGAACLADAGFTVTASDSDHKRVEMLSRGRLPVFEPGLPELVARVVAEGKLSFAPDPAEAVADKDQVWLMHDTPVDEQDRVDISVVTQDVERIAPGLKSGVVMVVTAQVPVGTCESLLAMIEQKSPGRCGGVAYIPENLRLGEAIERFRNPALPVVGVSGSRIYERLIPVLTAFHPDWEQTDLRTAEMVKHALNAYLATQITFGNEIGNLCEAIGVDGRRLARLLRLEPRIGPRAMLAPGLGFSGGTLARDTRTLIALGDKQGVPTELLDALWRVNQRQLLLPVEQLGGLLGGLQGRVVAVWGLTYKPGTSTLRRSAAVMMIGELNRKGARVRAFDPQADRKEVESVPCEIATDEVDACAGADALLIATAWPQFRDVDFVEVARRMRGRVVFDCNNLLDPAAVEKAGLQWKGIGVGRQGKLPG